MTNQDDLPFFVVGPDGAIHGEDTPENREIVRRIAACVQACDGLSTEELERGVVADMRRVIQQVYPLLQPQVEAAEATAKTEPAAESAPVSNKAS